MIRESVRRLPPEEETLLEHLVRNINVSSKRNGGEEGG
jgi:hypothetical protein